MTDAAAAPVPQTLPQAEAPPPAGSGFFPPMSLTVVCPGTRPRILIRPLLLCLVPCLLRNSARRMPSTPSCPCALRPGIRPLSSEAFTQTRLVGGASDGNSRRCASITTPCSPRRRTAQQQTRSSCRTPTLGPAQFPHLDDAHTTRARGVIVGIRNAYAHGLVGHAVWTVIRGRAISVRLQASDGAQLQHKAVRVDPTSSGPRLEQVVHSIPRDVDDMAPFPSIGGDWKFVEQAKGVSTQVKATATCCPPQARYPIEHFHMS